MEHGKYTDLSEKTPNTIWCFQKDGSFGKFVLNHAISGDSDSIYCKIPESITTGLSQDEIVQVADEVAGYVNESYPDFLARAFNCPKSRQDSMLSNREIVANAGLLLTKKRYIMRVVDDEGKKVDKLKIMGVEIIKSDTSQFTKKILMAMVNLILDGCPRSEVLSRIAEHKSSIYETPVSELATPAGCRTLLKAYKQLEEVGDLKGIHHTARSAIFYNSLCGIKDQKIRAGDKIGIVYIKHPKSKYLGFPKDAAYLPEWMDDIIIDYATHWDKTLVKITNYLESMGWDDRSMTQNLRRDLFGIPEKKVTKKGKKK
jgi:DNA polymerase elongation subunit (family B)